MDPVISTLRVDVLTAMRSNVATRWGRAGGVDPYGRLYYIESGGAYVHHHRRRYDMKPRRYYLIPANTELAHGCPRRMVVRWCHFTATVLAGIDLFAYLSCDYEVAPRDPKRVEGLFARLVSVHDDDSPGGQTESRGILLQLLAPFVKTAEEASHDSARRRVLVFRGALEHVDENIEKPLRVPELASVVGYQSAYFSREFKKAFGIGPARYILRKKIETAQRLMIETDGTLSFIAERLSFTDAFHLSKTFKRVTGMTPSEFRKRGRAGIP